MDDVNVNQTEDSKKNVEARRHQVIGYAYLAYEILLTRGHVVSSEGEGKDMIVKRRANDFNGFNFYGVFGSELRNGYTVEIYYFGQMVLKFIRRGFDRDLKIETYMEGFPPGDQPTWQMVLDYTMKHKSEIITAIENGDTKLRTGIKTSVEVDVEEEDTQSLVLDHCSSK